jgi:hypothetical protein
MSTDSNISVKIGADASGLRAGAAEAKGHVDSLLSTLKEFKAEQVSQSRTSRFFAAQLAEIVPGAEDAKKSMQGLIGVLLSGGGAAAAFEGIIFAIKEIHSGLEAQEKVLKAIEADYTKIGNEGRDAYEKIQQGLLGLSPAQVQWQTDVKNTREGIEKIDKAIKDVEEGTHPVLTLFELLNTITGAGNSGLTERADVVARLREEQKKLIEQLAELKKKRDETEGKAQAKQQKEDLAQAKEDAAKWRSSELIEWKKYYDAKTAEALKALQDEIDAQDRQALDLATFRADEFQNYKKHYDKVTEETLHTMQEIEQRNKELVTVVVNDATRMGAAFGTAFAGIISGTMSASRAFAEMSKAALKAILDMVRRAIEAYALQAAAAAAAANAGIPVVGLFAAAAAAAAMEALVMGLLGSLPSAAVGMPMVPADMPVMVHRNERILTVARQSRRALAQRRGRRRRVNITHPRDGQRRRATAGSRAPQGKSAARVAPERADLMSALIFPVTTTAYFASREPSGKGRSTSRPPARKSGRPPGASLATSTIWSSSRCSRTQRAAWITRR